ncbi:hypothetical protein JK358_27080 [Nocardia sp. 2]|uniref:YfhO family protein n=1 Tax=Nocardia acididurans TaxID=2802282 RepID=A0ABS1MBX6_9NOCA|nr:hypothetical protein [Nocardia acididurans]
MILGYAAVLLANARHFYTDDTESQYTGLWVGLGRALRAGEFPVLWPEQWMSGNNTMDDAGLFNPPQLLIDLIAPSFDNMAVYATLVKLVFSIIAALGVYRICLAYGGRPAWSAVAGVAFPLSGFFLFFDEASWMTALTGTAWLVHAWASSVRYVRGTGGPIPVFVFLYLTISTQYIFPALEAALMLVAVAVGEMISSGRAPGGSWKSWASWRFWLLSWAPIGRLAAVALCAGLAGLLTFLPSMLSAKVTWRGTAQINNDQFLTIPWSESLNASLPSTLPAFTSWWGYVQPLPVTYIAWFLIPALAFIDWDRARSAWKELSSVALFAIIMLMWSAGPGSIGPLRWPVRLLPMLAIALLVLVCVLLGRFGSFRNWRARGIASLVLILALWVRSFSADPHNWIRHVLAAGLVIAVGAGVLWLMNRKGVAAACALVIAAMFPIAFWQVEAAQPTPMSYNMPTNRSEAMRAFPDFPGTTIQLADRGLVQPGDKSLEGAYSALVFGNYAKSLELDYVNGYTPTGHFYFGELLCMRWDSSVCPDAYKRLFTPEASTGRPLVDLMKLDRVVLQRALFPDVRNQAAPEGWTWVDLPGQDRFIWVLERENGLTSTVNGRVSAEKNVTATSLSETDTTSRVRVSSASGGQVVFARLGWPGYRATLNGQPVPIKTVAKSFVAVDVPAGTQNAELVLTWRPPGWKIGIATAATGLAGLAVLQWLYIRSRRRAGETAADEPSGEPERELAGSVS